MRRATQDCHNKEHHRSFLSTLSLRRATGIAPPLLFVITYFYPRSPCGERPPPTLRNLRTTKFLSTLSLRRATICQCFFGYQTRNFYPRSPCGERQRSTASRGWRGLYFYPRSPCGERLCRPFSFVGRRNISIHALLAESDKRRLLHSRNEKRFLSTLSLRRATSKIISSSVITAYFYPRSPCGERPERPLESRSNILNFYPRSPCGERRVAKADLSSLKNISIHALLAESD